MKKRFSLFLLLLLMICFPLFSQMDFSEADNLFYLDKFDQTKTLLEEKLAVTTDKADRSEIFWRLSRVYMSLGDLLDESDKSGKFDIYQTGEDLADKSLAEKDNPQAYLWKCSNLGRWGQTKGVLDSLHKTKPMLANVKIMIENFDIKDSSEAWYVLGVMYNSLPGWPLSFGDKGKALSYMRLATENIPRVVIYANTYRELAIQLWDRNWSKSKRKTEYKKLKKSWDKEEEGTVEQYGYFEGFRGVNYKPFWSTVTLGEISDRQEALMLLKYASVVYKSWKYHTENQNENEKLVEAQFKEWTEK